MLTKLELVLPPPTIDHHGLSTPEASGTFWARIAAPDTVFMAVTAWEANRSPSRSWQVASEATEYMTCEAWALTMPSIEEQTREECALIIGSVEQGILLVHSFCLLVFLLGTLLLRVL